MSDWYENPEAALREIELHREAADAYLGVPEDDRDLDYPEEDDDE